MAASASSNHMVIGLVVLSMVLMVVNLTLKYSRFSKWTRAKELLHEWARENGYTIMFAHECRYVPGPFALRSTCLQCTYEVQLQDATGKARKAWVRFGSPLRGLDHKEVAVHWA